MKVNILLKNLAPNEGLEPSTLRLKVWCSTDWANRALWRLTRQCYCHSWTVTNFHFNGAFIIFSLFVSVLTRKMKNWVHCPGIEPGSQEWESCMIPLHQQCAPTEERSFLCVCLREKIIKLCIFWYFQICVQATFWCFITKYDKRIGSDSIGRAVWSYLFTGAIPLLLDARTFACCVSALGRFVLP